jgi:hypothetical protein
MPRMKRELPISFLPPVLLSLSVRLGAAAVFVFGPETLTTLGAALEWARVSAVILGTPAFVVFGGIRIWKARGKLANAGALLASAAISVALLAANFGEPYGRLLWHKASYDAAAVQRPQDEVIVFDWGIGPGPVLFSRFKEYLVIARGGAVQKIEALRGHEINSRGDERQAIDSFLSAAWEESDWRRRFYQSEFDACRMRIVHLMGPYYYAADHC